MLTERDRHLALVQRIDALGVPVTASLSSSLMRAIRAAEHVDGDFRAALAAVNNAGSTFERGMSVGMALILAVYSRPVLIHSSRPR